MNKSNKTLKDWKEIQRRKAITLYEKGYTQIQIAEILEVSQASISIWVKKANKFGLEALKTKYSKGAPSKLTYEQKLLLLETLKNAPKQIGFSGNNWARKQVVELIRKMFNVTYHPSQVSRILKQFGYNK